jgi:hypothetical protein
VTAYEALRAHALEATGTGSPAGLFVLLGQGVAAWMSRRSACCAPVPVAASTRPSQVGDEIHTALVQVLAAMVLAGQREEPV